MHGSGQNMKKHGSDLPLGLTGRGVSVHSSVRLRSEANRPEGSPDGLPGHEAFARECDRFPSVFDNLVHLFFCLPLCGRALFPGCSIVQRVDTEVISN